MIEALIVLVMAFCFVCVFVLRYAIGVVTFWGRRYRNEGYQILQSNRTDFYLLDTVVICGLAVMYLYVRRYPTSFLQLWAMDGWKWLMFLALLLLVTLPFRKRGVFYNNQGLFILKPFQESRFVAWNEIGSIQKRRFSPKLHIVLDRNGRQLTYFFRNRKTRRFLELAQQNGIFPTASKWV